MKIPINRRKALTGLVTVGITAVASLFALRIPLTSHKTTHRKVAWKRLKDEPAGPGDFWASNDPNQLERQADNNYNLQMQAVHNSYYGTPAGKIGINSGGFWRPIGLVDC